MEYKIGEIFEYNGEWYQCLENNSHCCGCEYCDFGELGNCDIIACSSSERNDNKEVYFKKLKNVGEPYEYFVQHKGIVMLQPYKLFTAPFINGVICNVHYDTNTIDLEIKQNKEDMEEYRMHDAKEDIPEFDKVVDECLFGENKLNLKLFNLEAAKAGKSVCTRDGRKARIIAFDANGGRPIVALVTECDDEEEIPYKYHCDGSYNCQSIPSNNDLMMLPEKKEGWAKVRKDINLYDTKEEADRRMIGNDEYVTAKVCWEE
jgi:hypothetical protein